MFLSGDKDRALTSSREGASQRGPFETYFEMLVSPIGLRHGGNICAHEKAQGRKRLRDIRETHLRLVGCGKHSYSHSGGIEGFYTPWWYAGGPLVQTAAYVEAALPPLKE